MSKLFALLVGVEKYRPPVRPLNGCINDVNSLQEYLQQQNKDYDVRIEALTDEAATKDAIVAGFRNHLAKAGPDDVALFYYSGHGTQEEADKTIWRFESDAKLETLVCYDGIVEENGEESFNLLADKELRYLLHEVARNNPHIVTIFDCCHSGGNTRNHFVSEDSEKVQERRHIPMARLSRACPQRDWSQFVFADSINPEDLKSKPLGEVIPEGQHIQLAACSSDQSAFEVNGGGIFTSNLLKVLERSEGAVTYYDLRSRLRHFIKNQYKQTPQIYAQGRSTDPLFRGFLNREIEGKPMYGNVVMHPKKGLVMDLGAMHGISKEAKTVNIKSADGKQTFEAEIDTVEADHTILRMADPAMVDQMTPEGMYRGYVEGFLSSPIQIYIAPEAEALAEHLSYAGPNVHRAGGEHDADYAVYIRDNHYTITLPHDPERPLVRQTKVDAENAGQTVALYLRHISQFEFVKNLHNPNSYLFKGHPVMVEVFKMEGNQPGLPLDLSNDEINIGFEKDEEGDWMGAFYMKLTNRHTSKLHVCLLYLSEEFEVYPEMLQELTVGLEPGESVWAYEGDAVPLALPDHVIAYNWPESPAYFKIIASTQDFDVTLLQQDALPMPAKTRGKDEGAKGIVKLRKKQPDARDWTTRLLTLRLPNPVYKEEG